MQLLDGPGSGTWVELGPAPSVRHSLQEAMLILWALRVSGLRPGGYRSGMPDYLRDPEDLRYHEVVVRQDPPAPSEVSRMDRVLSWILLVPASRPEVRRAVGLGSMTHPLSGKAMFTARKLGELLGCSHTQAGRLFDKGIDHITVALARPGLCALAGGPVGPTRDEVLDALRRVHARPRVRRLVTV